MDGSPSISTKITIIFILILTIGGDAVSSMIPPFVQNLYTNGYDHSNEYDQYIRGQRVSHIHATFPYTRKLNGSQKNGWPMKFDMSGIDRNDIIHTELIFSRDKMEWPVDRRNQRWFLTISLNEDNSRELKIQPKEISNIRTAGDHLSIGINEIAIRHRYSSHTWKMLAMMCFVTNTSSRPTIRCPSKSYYDTYIGFGNPILVSYHKNTQQHGGKELSLDPIRLPLTSFTYGTLSNYECSLEPLYLPSQDIWSYNKTNTGEIILSPASIPINYCYGELDSVSNLPSALNSDIKKHLTNIYGELSNLMARYSDKFCPRSCVAKSRMSHTILSYLRAKRTYKIYKISDVTATHCSLQS